MVKQTKTFKKGNVTKKALSAILAASMVMTSSSFVMAAPVEVEDVAVEAAAEVAVDAEDNAEVVEEADATEENIGKALTKEQVGIAEISDVIYNGKEQTPVVTVIDTTINKAINPNEYTLTYSNNKDVGTAKVKVEFKTTGTYNGSASRETTFKIKPITLNAGNTTVNWKDNDGFVYDGTEKKPEVASVVYNDGAGSTVELASTDYEVKVDSGAKSAGDHIAYVVLKSDCKNFTAGTGTNKFGETLYKISQATFSDQTVAVETKPVPYKTSANDVKNYITLTNKVTGKKVADAITVTYTQNGKTVDNPAANMGTYTATITQDNAGDYKEGTITTTITVVANSLASAAENAVIYVDGEANANKLAKDADGNYTIPYDGNTHAVKKIEVNGAEGEYSVDLTSVKGKNAGDVLNIKLVGKNTFAGQEVTIPVKVVAKKIEKNAVVKKTATEPATTEGTFGYTAVLGTHKDGTVSDKAIVELWYNKTSSDKVMLEEGKDYTYTTDKVNKKIVVTGIGNYTTVTNTAKTLTLECDIDTKKLYLADSSITATVEGTYSWIKTGVTPSVDKIKLVENGTKVLEAGKDFEIDTAATGTVSGYGLTAKNPGNVNAGVGYITIKGKGDDYTGTRVVTFDIAGKSLKDTFKVAAIEDVKLDQTDASKNKKTPVVTYATTGAEAPDVYTLEYYKNGEKIDNITSTGTVTIKLIGKGNYTGTIETSYEVVGTDINTLVYADAIKDQKYTGSAVTPMVTLTKKPAVTKDLELGKDYTVSYTNNTEAGTATAVVKGIGQYSGTILVTFKIVGQMEQDVQLLAAQVRDIQNRTMNSKATTVKFEAGKAPKTAVTYTSSDENVVKVDETGKITYTGIGEATITIKAAETAEYKAAEATMTVKVGLAKPSFTPFSKNNAFTLTSSTVKGAEKFEVEYATKKDFSNSKTKTFATTSAGKVRQVKVSAADKKTYYVRVRAISGTTKSAWSGVKTVATK